MSISFSESIPPMGFMPPRTEGYSDVHTGSSRTFRLITTTNEKSGLRNLGALDIEGTGWLRRFMSSYTNRFGKRRLTLVGVAILAVVIVSAILLISSRAATTLPSSAQVQNSATQTSENSSSGSSGLQSEFTLTQTTCTSQKSSGIWLGVTITLHDNANRQLNFDNGNITLQQLVLSNGTIYYPKQNASVVFGPQNGAQWVETIFIPVAAGMFGTGQAANAVLLIRVHVQGQGQPILEGIPITISSPLTSYAACS
jgi:hypothetical protein